MIKFTFYLSLQEFVLTVFLWCRFSPKATVGPYIRLVSIQFLLTFTCHISPLRVPSISKAKHVFSILSWLIHVTTRNWIKAVDVFGIRPLMHMYLTRVRPLSCILIFYTNYFVNQFTFLTCGPLLNNKTIQIRRISLHIQKWWRRTILTISPYISHGRKARRNETIRRVSLQDKTIPLYRN